MPSEVDRLLTGLSPTIEQKCTELKAARRERIHARLFVLLCVMIAIIPALLIFAGISLTVLIAPLLFMSLSVIFLLPVLLSGKTAGQGGTVNEQT